MQRWRSEEPLSWGRHIEIQTEDHLMEGIEKQAPWWQCHILMTRSVHAISDAMNFPKQHEYPLGVVNGNEFARRIAYFLVAQAAAEKIWNEHALTWPDVGFVKIGNASSNHVEMAVAENLSVCWLAVAGSRNELSITDETLCNAELAKQWHEKILAGLAKRRWPTDPYEIYSLVSEMRHRLHASAKLIQDCETADEIQFVTLLQCAKFVNRSKRTLERYKTEDTAFPTPAVIGQDGKADEWKWSIIKPYLEKKCSRRLPERFPTLTR